MSIYIPIFPATKREAKQRKRSLKTEDDAQLQATLALWHPAIGLYSELVLDLRTATDILMSAKQPKSLEEDWNQVSSLFLTKSIQLADEATSNYMFGQSELPTIATRTILESLFDIKFILADKSGNLAKRFYHYSLKKDPDSFKDFLTLENKTKLEDRLKKIEAEQAQLANASLTRWAAIGKQTYSVEQRAEDVGLGHLYQFWYRELSGHIHNQPRQMIVSDLQADHSNPASPAIHRSISLTPVFLLQIYEAFTKGTKTPNPTVARWLRHQAIQNTYKMFAALPNVPGYEPEIEAIQSILKRYVRRNRFFL